VGTSVRASAATVGEVQQFSLATFEGRTIDLTQGWQGAQACLAWESRGILECFATEAELEQAESQLAGGGAGPVQGAAGLSAGGTIQPNTTSCSSPLNLYSQSNYGGLHLALYDEGYWQELSYYGWAFLTRSFSGGACAFHLANGTWGSGYWYPGYTGPYGSAADMGSWDNTVQSVYII
jgi:hypothetical protein